MQTPMNRFCVYWCSLSIVASTAHALDRAESFKVASPSFAGTMNAFYRDTSSNSRELATGDHPTYPEEITCMDQSYNGFLDLSYTYAMETISDVNIYDVIDNIEGEILMKLSETILTCGGNVDGGAGDEEYPFDRQELGIVGVNSLPPDSPSQLSHCVSAFNDCTIVHGSLTLFLRQDAHLEYVRYAARYVINEAMKNNFLVSPRVEFLVSASYKGPRITKPDSYSVASTEVTTETPATKTMGGMNALNKVIIATLCSAVVGIVAAFLLFKKVFHSRQNCFASCDGTGVEKDYIEEAHFRSPSQSLADDNIFPIGDCHELDENQVVEYDIANGLKVIHEGSDALSMNESYDSSTMTNFSNRLNASCDLSIGWSETKSMASEKTIPTSNGTRLRTPTFGDDEQDRDLRII